MRNWLIWAFLVALNVFDWQATTLILALGGMEANPIMQAIIEQFGTTGIILAKLPVLAVIGLLLAARGRMAPRAQRLLDNGLVVVTIAYSLLAVWHLKLIYFIA